MSDSEPAIEAVEWVQVSFIPWLLGVTGPRSSSILTIALAIRTVLRAPEA